MKEQLEIGLKNRKKILNKLVDFKKNILSLCIFEYEDLKYFTNEDALIQPREIDYMIYFVFQVLKHMSNNYYFVLNQYKHFGVYYDLVNVLFDV